MRRLLSRLLLRLPLEYYPYLSYMHKYHCVFVHIPKNAGSSILKLLGYDGRRTHARWYEFKRANVRWFNQYHKFAVVREPLSRLTSSYKYCLAGGNQSDEDLALAKRIRESSKDFNSFILNVLDHEILAVETPFQPQYWYIFDRKEQLMVDALLRYESLEEDWAQLASKLSLPQDLPWVNMSEGKGMSSTQLSREAIDKVVELYRKDFILLGYELP